MIANAKKTICNTPSIWVEFKEPQHDSKVLTTIKYIVRFWGLVMGRVTTLSNIVLYDTIMQGIREYLLRLAEKQIQIAFQQSEKEVMDLR